MHSTMKVGDVPEKFREPGILGSYRRPGMTFTDTGRTLLTLHNETCNIWSHLLASVLFGAYIFAIPVDFHLDPTSQPLLALLITCCLYTFLSSQAHLFNAMSPLVRDIGFMIDYFGIATYTFGTAIANKTYAFPQSWCVGVLDHYYLPGMFVFCVIQNYILCRTRFIPQENKASLIRVVTAMVSYLFAMLPCIHRMFYMVEGTPIAASNAYALCFVLYIVSAVLYSSHFPEILIPGYFDICFSSHTVFHITSAAGSFYHVKGLILDFKNQSVAFFPEWPPLLILMALVVVNTLTVIGLSRRLATRRRISRNDYLLNIDTLAP